MGETFAFWGQTESIGDRHRFWQRGDGTQTSDGCNILRVTLGAGETRTLEFTLGPGELRYWHPLERDWVIDAAQFDVWVGGDAAAAHQKSEGRSRR